MGREEGRDGGGRTRSAGGEAQEEEKCGMEQGTFRGDEEEMGKGEEGGEVEPVEFWILTGAMPFWGVLRLRYAGCLSILGWPVFARSVLEMRE